MSAFGTPVERLAKELHEARMAECWGSWSSPSRFRWPDTREEWEHLQHHPHPAIGQAMAQAKALVKARLVDGIALQRLSQGPR